MAPPDGADDDRMEGADITDHKGATAAGTDPFGHLPLRAQRVARKTAARERPAEVPEPTAEETADLLTRTAKALMVKCWRLARIPPGVADAMTAYLLSSVGRDGHPTKEAAVNLARAVLQEAGSNAVLVISGDSSMVAEEDPLPDPGDIPAGDGGAA